MAVARLRTPPWCQFRVDDPPNFTVWTQLLFSLSGGVFCANLYYAHSILPILAKEFHTDQTTISTIVSLAHAREVTGLIFLIPLSDFVSRRTLVLCMLTTSTIFWIGLCITQDLLTFQVLTYLSACTEGVAQIFIVITYEISVQKNGIRSRNVTIVSMGGTIAIMLARLMSGTLTTYMPWRWVYWIALGLQITMLLLLWSFMPDYPSTSINKMSYGTGAALSSEARQREDTTWESLSRYPTGVATMSLILLREPSLAQVCVVGFLVAFAIGNFWTILSFLLIAAPYNYCTLYIGLFGLVGISTLFGTIYLNPRLDRVMPVRLYTCLIAISPSPVATIIGAFAGTHHISVVVVQAVLLDLGYGICNNACRLIIAELSDRHQNRMNTIFAISLFSGMSVGTKLGNLIFQRRGWTESGLASITCLVCGYLFVIIRGPHASWIG